MNFIVIVSSYDSNFMRENSWIFDVGQGEWNSQSEVANSHTLQRDVLPLKPLRATSIFFCHRSGLILTISHILVLCSSGNKGPLLLFTYTMELPATQQTRHTCTLRIEKKWLFNKIIESNQTESIQALSYVQLHIADFGLQSKTLRK